jgi:hypothetical protein
MSLVENNQLYVFEDMHQLLHQIHDCMWVLDEQKKPTNKIKDEARYHLAACLRYLASILVVKQVYGERKAQVWKW